MTRDRWGLVLYSAAVLLATLVHRIDALALLLGVALALSGRRVLSTVRKSLRTIVVFNAVVTVSYIAVALLEGSEWWRVVVLINLRVFLLSVLTTILVHRVNLLRALSFSRSLVYVISVATGQISMFRRTVVDFRLAFRSRMLGRASVRDRYRHAAATASFLVARAVQETTEVTLAMKARGFFDD